MLTGLWMERRELQSDSGFPAGSRTDHCGHGNKYAGGGSEYQLGVKRERGNYDRKHCGEQYFEYSDHSWYYCGDHNGGGTEIYDMDRDSLYDDNYSSVTGTGKSGNQITLSEGVILWVAFLLYLGYLFYCAKKNKEEVVEEEAKPMWKLLLATVLGLLLVVWGSDVTVDAAKAIARVLGISERVIGLTVVALGTSLPELFTSVSAARKGKADIAIGNIVGSNIFNILFVVGTAALIVPVEFLPGFGIDTVIALGAGLLLWVCIWRKRALTRPAGIVMLIAYLAYFMYLM